MKSILCVSTLFSDFENRNIENLKLFYNDISQMKANVQLLFATSGVSTDDFAGKKILIKPNWVRHYLKPDDEICLTTHPNFVLAVLEVMLEYNPKSVVIGDAPVQGCIWDKMIPESFFDKVAILSHNKHIPVKIVDFRKTRCDASNKSITQKSLASSEYVMFDLGDKSYLEPLSTSKNVFRVTSYDPDRLAESHKKGKHLYCITSEFFEADYIIALPKAKTHQKTGLTGALKLMVGINGDKDYLPHHRVGGTEMNGDCYPGKNCIRRLSEFFLDKANHDIGKLSYRYYRYIAKMLWNSCPISPLYSLSAAWYGNDTTWRMVLDLNLIARYGQADGTISEKPQRTILYICDGIIGGQGNGPLDPEPLPLGIIMMSENPALMDIALAGLMSFDIEKLPLLTESRKTMLTNEIQIFLNEQSCNLDDLSRFSIPTQPAPGWKDYLCPKVGETK